MQKRHASTEGPLDLSSQDDFFSFSQDDISGDYRKIILALVAEEQYLKKK